MDYSGTSENLETRENSETLNLYLRDKSDLEIVANPLQLQSETAISEVEESLVGLLAKSEFLSESSPRDKPWDSHRADAEAIAKIYGSDEDFGRLSERVSYCSLVLGFAWGADRLDRQALTLKLRSAHFCRVRHCPVCQWRRSQMWVARFLQALPKLLEANQAARFVFMTLTQRNVAIGDLRVTLRSMNSAWARLSERKALKAGVLGWIRTTEVTRGKDGSAHPHFHVLMMVQSNYFTKHYVKQPDWVQMWRKSLRADYDPIVDIRPIRGSSKSIGSDPQNPVIAAARETLKYSVKPTDMIADRIWFLELTRQVNKMRFIASGGILKDILRPDEESEKEMLLLRDAEEADGLPSVYYDWHKQLQRYKRKAEQ